jgi:hypothetical protein
MFGFRQFIQLVGFEETTISCAKGRTEVLDQVRKNPYMVGQLRIQCSVSRGMEREFQDV